MVDSTNLPEVDINAIATDLNNKADRDLVNSTVPYVVSRTANSNNGVTEIWSDGYCVQTGYVENLTTHYTTINLQNSYKDTSYVILLTSLTYGDSDHSCIINVEDGSKTTSKFIVQVRDYNDGKYPRPFYFRTEGYIR